MSKIKSRASFYLFLAAIAAVSCLLFVLLWGILRVFVVLFGLIAAVYWSVYFYSLKYDVSDNSLIAENGIFIRKTRKIELSEIVLETRIGIGETVFVTILRTAGGGLVVFGKLGK